MIHAHRLAAACHGTVIHIVKPFLSESVRDPGFLMARKEPVRYNGRHLCNDCFYPILISKSNQPVIRFPVEDTGSRLNRRPGKPVPEMCDSVLGCFPVIVLPILSVRSGISEINRSKINPFLRTHIFLHSETSQILICALSCRANLFIVLQPFTAPAAIPSTMFFCSAKYTSRSGSIDNR